MRNLPDTMPEGCNFYALLDTEISRAAVAECFAAAGWSVAESAGGPLLIIAWGRLTLAGSKPMVLQGWIDRPDERAVMVQDLLYGAGLTCACQWLNAGGQLWRDVPFDESMLDLNDPRLPADVKETIRASFGGTAPTPGSESEWWRFW